MKSFPVVRPVDMPEFYSINHVLIWLGDHGTFLTGEPISDLNIIYNEFAEIFDIPGDLMKSKKRNREIIIPKYIMMYVAVRKTSEKMTTIGKFFKSDHSIVNHAYNSVCDLIDTKEPVFMYYWEAFKKYSKYYSQDLEKTKKTDKRLFASLAAIKNEICNMFDLADKDFFYGKGGKEIICRFFFCKISILIGHPKIDISKYLKQYADYPRKSEKSLQRMFDKRNRRVLGMWEKYVLVSRIYNKIKPSKIRNYLSDNNFKIKNPIL